MANELILYIEIWGAFILWLEFESSISTCVLVSVYIERGKRDVPEEYDFNYYFLDILPK